MVTTLEVKAEITYREGEVLGMAILIPGADGKVIAMEVTKARFGVFTIVDCWNEDEKVMEALKALSKKVDKEKSTEHLEE